MKVLIIDNYDSFVYNLKDAFEDLGADVSVFRNDAIGLDGVRAQDPDAIVISPGPGHPSQRRDFGVCGDVLGSISHDVPTLGVCLGHQGIAHFHGGRVVAAPSLVHGKTSMIRHDGTGLFAGLPEPMQAGRYHSFTVDRDVPSCLEVTARTDDGVIMALRHRQHPMFGVQFHPESVLTPDGPKVLANFLREARA